MFTENTLQDHIGDALRMIARSPGYDEIFTRETAFASLLFSALKEKEEDTVMYLHPDKPFVEIHVNLVEKKWHNVLKWGTSFLELRISRLAPVFIQNKVMIQSDYSMDPADINDWETVARERETILGAVIEKKAKETGYTRLTGEVSQDVDTGSLHLNAHYRKWKPTVYAVFFEKITE